MNDDARALARKKVGDLRTLLWSQTSVNASNIFAKAPPAIPDDYDKTSLFLLCRYGDFSTLKTLLDQGAASEMDVLRLFDIAADKGHTDIVRYFIEQGVNIHKDDENALLSASANGHLDIVELLFAHGADIHISNDYCLKAAAEKGHTEIAEFFLKHNADVQAWKGTVIQGAAENNHFDTVALLLKWGASLNALDPAQQGRYNAYIFTTKLYQEIAKETLTRAFNASLWAGHVPEMLELWNQVPKVFQNEIDFSHTVSSVRSQSLKQSRGNKPKMIGRHQHD
jgi:ankyrin repeat protein